LLPPDVGWESCDLLLTLLEGISTRYSNLRNIVIKCRTKTQYDRISTLYRGNKLVDIKWGYGDLLDMIDADTVVIGPPGSAFLECRSAGHRFIGIFNLQLFRGMDFFDIRRVNLMHRNGELSYTAEEALELLDKYIND